MKIIILIFLLYLFNSSTILLFSQTNTGDEIAKSVINAINSGDTKQLKSIQATPGIYRKIAPSQMKDKSDLEVMTIVNFSGNSIFDEVKRINESLVSMGLNPEKVKFIRTKIEKFEYINSEFRIINTFCSYEGVVDTLVLEGYLQNGKWYLVDLANDDKDLNNIIEKKATLSYEQIYAKGLESMKEDNWGEALNYFQKVILAKPDFKEAYYKCGYSYIEIGNFLKAEEVLKMGSKLFPDYKDIHVELGYVYSKNGKTKEAKSVFDKAISLDSNSYWAYFYSGTMLFDIQQYSEALKYFNGAVKYNPSNYYNPYQSRARTHFKLNNYLQSKEDYIKVTEISPDISDSYYYLGWIENDFGSFEVAINYFNKYLEYEANNTDAIYERGYAFKGIKKWENAIKDFELAREVIEKFEYKGISKGKLYKHLADCYYSTGLKQKACDFYKKAEESGESSVKELLKSLCNEN